MRRIPSSNGLELGIPNTGPWIDIISLQRLPVTLQEAEDAVRSPLHWHLWKPEMGITLEHMRNARGLVAVDEESRLTLRFLWPRRMQPLEALYAIEAAEGKLPPALAGACLAATAAKAYPAQGVNLLALACALGDAPQAPSARLNRRRLDELADAFLADLPGEEAISTVIPAGAVDRARFWLAVAQKLWQPATLQALAATEPNLSFRILAASLASAWHWLQDLPKVQVAGVNLSMSEEASATGWLQALEWEAGHIPSEALHYLANGHVPPMQHTLWRIAGYDEMPDQSVDLAHGLASTLLREADEHAVYVPAGGFLLALPADYPLRAWGVEALRVWASPDGLWCMTVSEHGPDLSFGWRPRQSLRPWVLTESVMPLLEVTLAALWRDLRVAGDEALPHMQRGGAGQREPRPSAPLPRHPIRTLPTLRRLSLGGKRTWGSDEEQAIIRRRAHGVRGHLRRLPSAWSASEDARQFAAEYGLPIPDGFTFVRPHIRGADSGAEAITAEPIIHARGLAAVLTLLG